MANPFESADMAGGYANSRPAVHPRVLEQALAQSGSFERALDVGCGAGLSTKALLPFAAQSIGLDPSEAMVKCAASTTPTAQFITATAEAIPLHARAVDLITAAGSLNYADLGRFFPEALRVLEPRGLLLVYDFSPGRAFRNHGGLDQWFSQFMARYPAPPGEARTLNPEILAQLASGFRLAGHRYFEIAIALTPAFYLDYMMTETNVAAALRRGVPRSQISSWCSATLAQIWSAGERDVLFGGYFACLVPVPESAPQ